MVLPVNLTWLFRPARQGLVRAGRKARFGSARAQVRSPEVGAVSCRDLTEGRRRLAAAPSFPVVTYAGLTLYQLMEDCIMSSAVVIALALAWYPRSAWMSSVKAVAMSTLDASSEPPSSVPRPPLPGVPTLAAPEAKLVW